MPSDPVEPRGERNAGVAIGPEPSPGAKEHLGDRILVLGPQPESDQPGYGRQVRAIEVAEGIAITVLSSPDEGTLVLPPIRLISTLPIERRGRDVRGGTAAERRDLHPFSVIGTPGRAAEQRRAAPTGAAPSDLGSCSAAQPPSATALIRLESRSFRSASRSISR